MAELNFLLITLSISQKALFTPYYTPLSFRTFKRMEKFAFIPFIVLFHPAFWDFSQCFEAFNELMFGIFSTAYKILE